MDVDQQPKDSLVGDNGRTTTSAASANNLPPAIVTATPIQPASLSDATKIKILAVEIGLLEEFYFQKFGVRVFNLNSSYFKAFQQPTPKMNQIKRNLDAALVGTPPLLNQDGRDDNVDLDVTLIVVKEEPNWAEVDTMIVEPGEPDFDSGERTDSVDGNVTTLLKERNGLNVAVATPDVCLRGPSSGALTTALLSEQDRHITQKTAARAKRNEKARGRNNVKGVGKKKTSTLPFAASRSRVKQSSAKRNQSTAVSRNGERNKKHKCDFCNKAFVDTYHKKRHELTHTGEKPFKCNLRPMAFTRPDFKLSHERCQTDEKPYHCDLCTMSFARLSNKKRHILTHTREKPFQCEECGRTFAHNSDKVSHMRIHTGDKPYHFQYCHKQFRVSSHLSTHLRIHTNEKPYTCLVCAKAFSDASHFRRHEKTHRK